MVIKGNVLRCVCVGFFVLENVAELASYISGCLDQCKLKQIVLKEKV